MILFKAEHVEPTLSGQKTQTRRIGKCRWKVGSIRQAKTNYSKDSEFAKIRILDVRRERLGDITEEDAIREGASSIEDYIKMYIRSYEIWTPDREVWVVTYELVEEMKDR